MRLKYTEADKERIKSEINLIEYIRSLGYEVVKTFAGKATFYSPLREEKKPSFTVSYYHGRWAWKDWGSGDEGDIFAFVQKKFGLSFVQAMDMLMKNEFPAECCRREIDEENQRRQEQERKEKVEWIKKLYPCALKRLDARKMEEIRDYFQRQGVPYYPEMGCVMYRSSEDRVDYVGTPLPNPFRIRGLECRSLSGHDRKTLGIKTLWVLPRNRKRILVAESILDSLSGVVVLKDRDMSLCSINGTGNIEKLAALFTQYRPEEALFALDNDEPGNAALQRGMQIAKAHDVAAILINDHIVRGVKDLHKAVLELERLRQPSLFEKTG